MCLFMSPNKYLHCLSLLRVSGGEYDYFLKYMSKLRLRKVERIAHHHTAKEWQIQDFNQCLWVSNAPILSMFPCFLFETLRHQTTAETNLGRKMDQGSTPHSPRLAQAFLKQSALRLWSEANSFLLCGLVSQCS